MWNTELFQGPVRVLGHETVLHGRLTGNRLVLDTVLLSLTSVLLSLVSVLLSLTSGLLNYGPVLLNYGPVLLPRPHTRSGPQICLVSSNKRVR